MKIATIIEKGFYYIIYPNNKLCIVKANGNQSSDHLFSGICVYDESEFNQIGHEAENWNVYNFKKVTQEIINRSKIDSLLKTSDLDEKEWHRLEFINKQYNQSSFQTIKEALDKYYNEVLGNINQGNEYENLPLIERI